MDSVELKQESNRCHLWGLGGLLPRWEHILDDPSICFCLVVCYISVTVRDCTIRVVDCSIRVSQYRMRKSDDCFPSSSPASRQLRQSPNYTFYFSPPLVGINISTGIWQIFEDLKLSNFEWQYLDFIILFKYDCSTRRQKMPL